LNHHRFVLPAHLSHLPAPSADALVLSRQLQAHIRSEIASAGGWISFARYMELVLYAPGLGYYTAGSTKFGREGDFVTAPELSPLFARCLARQIGQLIAIGVRNIIEVGPGSGALATELLQALAVLDCLPERYQMLEVSAELKERQRRRIESVIPSMLDRVEWLETLPGPAEAIVIANEVLDALPVHVVHTRDRGRIDEKGVSEPIGDQSFTASYRVAGGAVAEAAQELELAPDYETEIGLAARAFVTTFATIVDRGALFFIDYGFPAREYYHPQRSHGTLMCHYRHAAHADPFAVPGLQDITAHVDFTAVANAATGAGHRVFGYTTQAQFLINCGITEMLATKSADDVAAYVPLASSAHKLLSPAEMGELFKVIAVGRGIDVPLVGFIRGDRTHTL
jgi:SAM-dependent MidA family methyltransferase